MKTLCECADCWEEQTIQESFADEETCRDRHPIEHLGRWLDQRVAILTDQPLCSDELDDQLSSLLCQLIH